MAFDNLKLLCFSRSQLMFQCVTVIDFFIFFIWEVYKVCNSHFYTYTTHTYALTTFMCGAMRSDGTSNGERKVFFFVVCSLASALCGREKKKKKERERIRMKRNHFVETFIYNIYQMSTQDMLNCLFNFGFINACHCQSVYHQYANT